MAKCGIYKIKNIRNNKIYIGKSKDINHRISDHKSSLRKNSHRNKYLQRSYNKYGINCFEFSIIELCEESLLEEKEIFYIKELNSKAPNGYNLTDGGGSLGRKLSLLTIQKIKDFFLKNGSPMKGRSHTEETRQKMSSSSKGKSKNFTKEWRDKITFSISGQKQSNGKTSKYIGVSWVTRDKRYRVYFRGKAYGSFTSEIAAAERFDEISWKELHDLNKLNFPEKYK